MFISEKSRWSAAAVAMLTLWYAAFEWNGIDYPGYNKGPCYSPNNAYYVTRHQTLWQAISTSSQDDFGTARLVDRAGKVLYEKQTLINGEFGPQWSGGPKNGSARNWVVYYQGTEEPGWWFDLPEDPGLGDPNIKCYPRIVD